MLHELTNALRGMTADRAVLIANHLLSAEPAGAARLAAHTGRVVRFAVEGGPGGWGLPELQLRITPAGLLERLAGDAPAADLSLVVELPPGPVGAALSLLRGALGEPPAVRVVGDAAMAADVDWCLHNVRWDAEHDLARLLGDLPARRLVAAVRWVGEGIRATLRRHVPAASKADGAGTTAGNQAGTDAG